MSEIVTNFYLGNQFQSYNIVFFRFWSCVILLQSYWVLADIHPRSIQMFPCSDTIAKCFAIMKLEGFYPSLFVTRDGVPPPGVPRAFHTPVNGPEMNILSSFVEVARRRICEYGSGRRRGQRLREKCHGLFVYIALYFSATDCHHGVGAHLYVLLFSAHLKWGSRWLLHHLLLVLRGFAFVLGFLSWSIITC